MQTINLLKERCATLIKEEQNNLNSGTLPILITIQQILNQPNALIKLDAEIVLNILKDLGFSKKEIPEIYSSILKGN